MTKELLLFPFALAGLLSLSILAVNPSALGLQARPADTTKAVKPFNVPCNTEADEDDPHVADAGLTLYYTAGGKGGKEDILFVSRKFSTQAWPKKGQVIEDYVTTKGDDRSVYATQGKYPHYLYFGTKKDDKSKNFDLFVAVRQDRGKAWSAPTPVMNVNTEADELYPWVTGNGKSLYFSRKTKEGWRVFVANRAGSTGPGGWEDPEPVDLPVDFHHVTLTPDGKRMYLHGPLDGDRTGLFTSTATAKGWTKPEPLEELNDPDGKTGDRSPNLTRDGRFLYFASDRPGGKGGLDLWGVQTAMLKKR